MPPGDIRKHLEARTKKTAVGLLSACGCSVTCRVPIQRIARCHRLRRKSRQKRHPAVFLEAPVPTVASIHHLAMVAPPHRWIDTNEAFTGRILEKFLGGAMTQRGIRFEA
jgi:hypothetical protein